MPTTSCFILCLAKVRKRHETTLGKAQKVAAEDESLKVVSEFYMSFAIDKC